MMSKNLVSSSNLSRWEGNWNGTRGNAGAPSQSSHFSWAFETQGKEVSQVSPVLMESAFSRLSLRHQDLPRSVHCHLHLAVCITLPPDLCRVVSFAQMSLLQRSFLATLSSIATSPVSVSTYCLSPRPENKL